MRHSLHGLVAAVLLLPATVLACGSGHVWLDENRDGVRDAHEPGIAGVAVSDGRRIVWTDADGRYRLELDVGASGPLFVVKPAGHVAPARADGLPAVWQVIDLEKQAGCPGFALWAEQAPPHDTLDVLVFSDPQTANLEQVGYYRDAIVQPLVGQHAATLGVTLGDITNDAPALYPALKEVTAMLDVPWLHVPGNHDLDFDVAHDDESLQSFHAAFGPDTYAWEETQAVFVVLDDVIYLPGQRPAYVGGLREAQFEFLEAYLPTADKDRLLVLMMHIPLFNTSEVSDTFRVEDRERLFGLLARFPHLLILSGHRHSLQHHYHTVDDGWSGETPLHEFNVGAASGSYWSGAPNALGFPDATMADGTPNGHARLRVHSDGQYALQWHPAYVPEDDAGFTRAMRLHAPRVLRQGAYPAWGVYANVFMGLEDTRVEFRVNESDWQPMRKVLASDGWLRTENARDDLTRALRGFDRSPEAEPSPHLWRAALPTRLEAGEHEVEVRAFDAWTGEEQRASLRYRLLDWDVPSEAAGDTSRR